MYIFMHHIVTKITKYLLWTFFSWKSRYRTKKFFMQLWIRGAQVILPIKICVCYQYRVLCFLSQSIVHWGHSPDLSRKFWKTIFSSHFIKTHTHTHFHTISSLVFLTPIQNIILGNFHLLQPYLWGGGGSEAHLPRVKWGNQNKNFEIWR